MINPQNMKKFFELKAKASKDVDDAVAAELKVPDPDLVKSKAILSAAEASKASRDPEGT